MNTNIDIPIEIAKSEGVNFISIRSMIEVLIKHNVGITNTGGISSSNKKAISDMLLTLIRMLKQIDDPAGLKEKKPTPLTAPSNKTKAVEHVVDEFAFLDI